MYRIHLAAGVAAVLAGGIVAAAQAAPEPTLPDLDERVPERIGVRWVGSTYAVGFDTTVVNTGNAPFVLEGQGPGNADMVARQIVGSQKITVGRMRYNTSFDHEHWHVEPFQRYELHGPGGRVLGDVKQGFCLSNLHDEWCARGKPDATWLETGLKAGGHDTYEAFIEGQYIPISPGTAPNGRYTLVVRVDPTSVFQERNNTTNNASSVALDLRWRDGEPSISIAERCLHSAACPRPPEPPPEPEPAPAPPPTPPTAVAPPPTPPALAPSTSPTVLRMTLAKGHRLARIALRREFRSARSRNAELRVTSCRPSVRDRVVCSVRWRTKVTTWRGYVRLVAVDAPPRWGYQLRVTGRRRNCTATRKSACTRRISRDWTIGGTYPGRAS